MNFKYFCKNNIIPSFLLSFLDNKKIRAINKAHVSGDYVFDVENTYILKISINKERLLREKEKNDYLSTKLPVSKTVFYSDEEKYAYYLKTKVKGKPLVSKEYLNNPKKLAKLLGMAISMFHNADASDCVLKNNYSDGNTLIHGDFCLPNILATGNKITGFIDTEGAGLGDPYADYAWCIWSFEYNLNSKEYTQLLLKELNIKNEREKMDKYLGI